jgi:hypothetical protein
MEKHAAEGEHVRDKDLDVMQEEKKTRSSDRMTPMANLHSRYLVLRTQNKRAHHTAKVMFGW